MIRQPNHSPANRYQSKINRKMGCWACRSLPTLTESVETMWEAPSSSCLGGIRRAYGKSGLVPVLLRAPLPMVSVEGMGATLGTPATHCQPERISRALVGAEIPTPCPAVRKIPPPSNARLVQYSKISQCNLTTKLAD